MESKTKVQLPHADIQQLFTNAFGKIKEPKITIIAKTHKCSAYAHENDCKTRYTKR